jgi:hypothetical protein
VHKLVHRIRDKQGNAMVSLAKNPLCLCAKCALRDNPEEPCATLKVAARVKSRSWNGSSPGRIVSWSATSWHVRGYPGDPLVRIA